MTRRSRPTEIAFADLPRLAGPAPPQPHRLRQLRKSLPRRRGEAYARARRVHRSTASRVRNGPNRPTGRRCRRWPFSPPSDRLDPATQSVARDLMRRNVDYLLDVYKVADPQSLGGAGLDIPSSRARSQLRCFREVAANVIGLPVPEGLRDAARPGWRPRSPIIGTARSTSPSCRRDQRRQPQAGGRHGYDPNIDIVSAAIYGAIPVTDPKLLATAAHLRRQWGDSSSPSFYPINGADAARGLGPLLGRYPGDEYDGDTTNPVPGGHPWVVCTANMAELYYRLASRAPHRRRPVLAALRWPRRSSPRFPRLRDARRPPTRRVRCGRRATRCCAAIIFHSDGLELGEQFDGATGVEKSVRTLDLELRRRPQRDPRPGLRWPVARIVSARYKRANPPRGRPMRILLTNDDGIHAAGLKLLEHIARSFPTTSRRRAGDRPVRRRPFLVAVEPAAPARNHAASFRGAGDADRLRPDGGAKIIADQSRT